MTFDEYCQFLEDFFYFFEPKYDDTDREIKGTLFLL